MYLIWASVSNGNEICYNVQFTLCFRMSQLHITKDYSFWKGWPFFKWFNFSAETSLNNLIELINLVINRYHSMIYGFREFWKVSSQGQYHDYYYKLIVQSMALYIHHQLLLCSTVFHMMVNEGRTANNERSIFERLKNRIFCNVKV